MQYMLLIYGDESEWAKLTLDQLSTEMGAYMAYSEELAKSGKLISGHELQPVETAKTVSVSGGKQKVVDGPFAETREARWAECCPTASTGAVEVRPTRYPKR